MGARAQLQGARLIHGDDPWCVGGQEPAVQWMGRRRQWRACVDGDSAKGRVNDGEGPDRWEWTAPACARPRSRPAYGRAALLLCLCGVEGRGGAEGAIGVCACRQLVRGCAARRGGIDSIQALGSRLGFGGEGGGVGRVGRGPVVA